MPSHRTLGPSLFVRARRLFSNFFLVIVLFLPPGPSKPDQHGLLWYVLARPRPLCAPFPPFPPAPLVSVPPFLSHRDGLRARCAANKAPRDEGGRAVTVHAPSPGAKNCTRACSALAFPFLPSIGSADGVA